MTDSPTRRSSRRSSRRRTSVVGVAGEVLITLGVVVLLFIVWQQWFNDILVSGTTRSEASSLSQKLHDEAGAGPTTAPVDGDYGTPAITPAAKDGEAFGVLFVPRFGADYQVPVDGGTGTAQTLDTGAAGHYDSTQMPGQVGNFAIAGHRTTHGAPFANIAQLKIGDHIYVQTSKGYYTYTFRNLQYVKPTQVQVLQVVPDAPTIDAASKDRLITLTSCNPKYSAAERIIAYGVFDSWRPLSAGPPAEIASLATTKS
ncbi:sortase A [Frondihabitans sp. PhB188]|uniref:class E sortase n=1 Tax=Frondihabitans sp. PhB188 TaxID=2485200 RepID=UPI000F486257|nr:class E sortase [Frondihabitans sp. PhB188]ROQ37102.1 sortase A [Frondihabitans sp. PhB188]